MWFFTVFGLMWRSSAIWPLSLPFAISFSTSSSLADSSELILRRLVLGTGRGAQALKHLGRDRRGDERFAGGCRADPGEQLVDRRVLQQVAAGAGEDRVHHVGVEIGDRQHDDARERREHRDLAGRLDAVHPRHVQIHQHDLGSEIPHLPQRLGAAVRLAGDQHALLLEQAAQPRAKQVVVVDDQDSRRESLVGAVRFFRQDWWPA